MSRLVLVLGDQLTDNLAALKEADPATDVVLMAEVREEATYVRHHKKKIAFIFSAMRHFAQRLRRAGWQVRYVNYDDPLNAGSIPLEIDRARHALGIDCVLATAPGEWRLREVLAKVLDLTVLPDDRFLTTEAEFARWAEGRKTLVMEHFYRDVRRKTGLLMEGDAPAGGQWNFDKDNRKPPPGYLLSSGPERFEPDAITQEVLELVEREFGNNFGRLTPYWFATTAEQAEAAAQHFIDHALPHFGDFQDAMLPGEPFLYHSILSLYLNVGLLDPVWVCRLAENAYLRGHAPLNAVEGFIRQIIGWREFIRGIYFLQGPDYVSLNHFSAMRPLPDFYWTGETDMACMADAIGQTNDEAYAHHIQRLMVTGNFALIAGINPLEVHEWYLAVYADAFEWVEAPNVIGMSQYADGGLLGTKPYASSGAYINRMSGYCRGCAYDVADKTGKTACPFNALYWDFLARNRETLSDNRRLAMPYRSWDRFDEGQRAAYLAKASETLSKLDSNKTI